MQIYIYPQKEKEEIMEAETGMLDALTPEGCFLELPQSPDLVVTQGADLELRFCGERLLDQRPIVACIGTDYITVDQKTCAVVGDVIELTCLDGCDVSDLEVRQQTIKALSSDGLKLTLDPGFPSVLAERCYRSSDLLEGCLDLSPQNTPPRFIILTQNWTLQGIAAHRISNGCVRSMGVTVSAGSSLLRTALLDVVQPDDHVSIPGAGISDAIVKSVRRSVVQDGLVVDVIELNQAAKATGCMVAMVADGLLIAFEIETEGACSIARIPAAQTAKLLPPHGVEVPANADPMTFLGHYLFVAQSIVLKAGVPQLKTQAIDSGLLVLRSTAASSNALSNV